MAFEVLPVPPVYDVAFLNRVQQNVKNEFTALESPTPLPVQVVQWTASTPTYTVRPTDVYLVVNARGGPIKIVLPAPARATQAVSILNAYVTNAVTVVQADGAPLGNGDTSISIKGGETAQMVTDGLKWFRFGVSP